MSDDAEAKTEPITDAELAEELAKYVAETKRQRGLRRGIEDRETR